MPALDSNKSIFDLERIVSETFVEQVRFYEMVDSTNNAAIEYCRSDDLRTPLLVVAEQQTAGRGRGTNQWWSAPGALTFSLVIRPADLGLDERLWPRASLTTGLSVCLAINELLPRDNSQLKWPNDVFLHDRKVCGVLVEVGPQPAETLVLGIGVNVNNSFQTAPDELRSIATSLVDVTGQAFCLNQVLIAVLRQLEIQLGRLSRNNRELAADWQRHCALVDRTVEIDSGGNKITGVCQGIDEEGSLVLLTEGGPARFFAGVVSRVS